MKGQAAWLAREQIRKQNWVKICRNLKELNWIQEWGKTENLSFSGYLVFSTFQGSRCAFGGVCVCVSFFMKFQRVLTSARGEAGLLSWTSKISYSKALWQDNMSRLQSYCRWDDLLQMLQKHKYHTNCMFWFWLPPATKAPRGRPSPRRRAEENGKKEAETGGSG